MKLILVSDLHGQSRTLDYLNSIRLTERADGLIVCGDISANSPDFFAKFISSIDKFPTAFIVAGNADEEINGLIDESKYSINNKCKVLKGQTICGISYPEEDISQLDKISGSVLITHRPPQAKLLKNKYKNAPRFHISGHLHSRSFVKKYPSTTHIQVPTLQDKKYAIFDCETGLVEFKELA